MVCPRQTSRIVASATTTVVALVSAVAACAQVQSASQQSMPLPGTTAVVVGTPGTVPGKISPLTGNRSGAQSSLPAGQLSPSGKPAAPIANSATPTQPAANGKAAQLSGAVSSSLSDLERRFFGHCFVTDQADTRVARLEKLIFGECGSDSLEERIVNLSLSTVTAVQLAPLQDPVFSKQSKAQVADQLQPCKTSQAAAPAKIAHADGGSPMTYPRVTTLEILVSGKTFVQEPVSDRVARLETKVFGKTSDASDELLQRIERIETQAHVENIFLLMNNHDMLSVDTLTSYLGHPLASPERYSRLQQEGAGFPDWIAIMEEQVFGQAHMQEPLLDRVSILETKLFSAPSKDTGLFERIHRIWAEIEPAPIAVAGPSPGTTEQALPKSPASLSTAFQMPINPEMSKPADPSVDGFQLPVNPTLEKQTRLTQTSGEKETFSTVKTNKGVFHKLGKVLQVAGGAMMAGGYSTYSDDLLY